MGTIFFLPLIISGLAGSIDYRSAREHSLTNKIRVRRSHANFLCEDSLILKLVKTYFPSYSIENFLNLAQKLPLSYMFIFTVVVE